MSQVAALGRMKRWFDLVLTDSVAFSTKTDLPLNTIETLENQLMFCPDDPFDFLLLVLIHSKVNAIGDGTIFASRTEIMSNLGDGFGNWYDGQSPNMLPTAEEWFGPKRYYDKPWWHRSDGSMIDMWAGDDDDLTKKPDILIDLSDATDIIEDDENAKTAEIIKPNFRPTILKDE